MEDKQMGKITSLEEKNNKVCFTIGNETFCLSYFWLRDHCRCQACYNFVTFQRSVHILDIPEDIKPKKVYNKDGKLHVNWNDGHCSCYSPEFFLLYNHKSWLARQKRRMVLWSGDNIEEKVAIVNCDEFLKREESVKSLLESLLIYGVAFVDGVTPSKEATEKVINRIAPPQNTLFGTMWSVSTNLEHRDTAYFNIALACHTDSTYFYESTGLQVFHCLNDDCEGGETVLRDGFEAVKKLEVVHPNDVKILTNKSISSEYTEEGQDYKCTGPVIKYNKITGDLEQIRYNVYDRTPFVSLPEEDIEDYYKAYRNLAQEIENKGSQWRFKLKPGRLLVFDNWRVLHGRAAFSGNRYLSGCYISRSDWLSRARTFGLIG